MGKGWGESILGKLCMLSREVRLERCTSEAEAVL